MTRVLGATCVVKAATSCSYVRSFNFWGATSARSRPNVMQARKASFFCSASTLFARKKCSSRSTYYLNQSSVDASYSPAILLSYPMHPRRVSECILRSTVAIATVDLRMHSDTRRAGHAQLLQLREGLHLLFEQPVEVSSLTYIDLSCRKHRLEAFSIPWHVLVVTPGTGRHLAHHALCSTPALQNAVMSLVMAGLILLSLILLNIYGNT